MTVAGATGAAGAFSLGPVSSALAKALGGKLDNSMANFTGTVMHATHYGPFVATVKKRPYRKDRAHTV